MARLTALPSLEIIRGFKGKIDFYLWKGLPCARAWPRYRQERTTPGSKAAAALFGQILKGYGLLCAEAKAWFAEDAKDQPRTPRDLYVSAVLGHLHERTPIVPPTPTFTVWSPDAPPAAPSAFDDEFDDASFDTGLWTEFDPSAVLTVSEQEPGLILDSITQAGDDICGVYQPVPPGNFSITTKIALSALRADFAVAGLALWDDATDPAQDLYTWQLTYRAADQVLDVILWTNYTTFGAGIVSIADLTISTHLYLRIRRIGATYYFDWSLDGLGWQQIHSGGLVFDPDHFGIILNNVATGITIRAIATFFRFIPYGVFDFYLHGDRILETRHA